jgi:hypothetical protein
MLGQELVRVVLSFLTCTIQCHIITALGGIDTACRSPFSQIQQNAQHFTVTGEVCVFPSLMEKSQISASEKLETDLTLLSHRSIRSMMGPTSFHRAEPLLGS